MKPIARNHLSPHILSNIFLTVAMLVVAVPIRASEFPKVNFCSFLLEPSGKYTEHEHSEVRRWLTQSISTQGGPDRDTLPETYKILNTYLHEHWIGRAEPKLKDLRERMQKNGIPSRVF